MSTDTWHYLFPQGPIAALTPSKGDRYSPKAQSYLTLLWKPQDLRVIKGQSRGAEPPGTTGKKARSPCVFQAMEAWVLGTSEEEVALRELKGLGTTSELLHAGCLGGVGFSKAQQDGP